MKAQKTIRVALFGAGNVAGHLFRKFSGTPGVEITGLWNRHPAKWAEVAGTVPVVSDPERMPPADVYILAIKDDALHDFSRRLAGHDVLTVHTSGAVPGTELQTPRRGVFYPLQTFSPDRIPAWHRIPILYDASDSAGKALLADLAGRISRVTAEVSDEQRARLHVAAVFVSNFTNAMVQIADRIARESKVDSRLLRPLMEQNFDNLLHRPAREVLTGPARRGDLGTLERHLRELEALDLRDEKEIYRLISEWILREYGNG